MISAAIAHLLAEREVIEAKLAKAIADEYPIGTKVQWSSGSKLFVGIVEGYTNDRRLYVRRTDQPIKRAERCIEIRRILRKV